MKWLVTAANCLNHIDVYLRDGKVMTLVKRVPTGKTPSHVWIDSKSSTVYSTITCWTICWSMLSSSWSRS